MIIDSIQNIGRYTGVSAYMAKAIAYIQSGQLSELPVGTTEIEGRDVFVIVSEYQTKAESECKIETHRKYIDIQVMLHGEEVFGHDFLENQTIEEGYNSEKDYTFYRTNTTKFLLKENYFAIFFPNDLHQPTIASQNPAMVRKAVFKVKVG